MADASGQVEHCNRRIADYDPAARRGESYDWAALVHPDDLAATNAAWAQAQGCAGSYSFEHRLRMADGSWRWHLSRAEPSLDEAGEIARWYGTATDIHDRKSVEQAAFERLGQLEAIYRSAPLGLCLLDRDLRIVRINEALAKINGFPVACHLGRTVWDLVPSLRSSAEPIMLRVLATGEAVTGVELAGETAKAPGVIRHWLEQFYPIIDGAGAVSHIGVVCEEVTERRRAEAAMRESEARLRAVFAAIDEGFCLGEMILDGAGRPVDYRFLEVNPLFEAMSGLAGAVGRTALELQPDLEAHWIETYARVGLGGEQLRFQSGSAAMGRWFDVFATPVEPRGRFAVVFKDVTARNTAEAALRESEARFRAMADTAPAMLWITDHRSQCTFLSRGWFDYTGQTEAEGLGLGWLEAAHPEDRYTAAQVIMAAAEQRMPFDLDYRIRRADGTYRWAINAGRPRFGSDGAFEGFIGSVIDAHERKQAEDRQALLMREVNHRARNALAVVQSIVRLTRADNPADFVATIEGRIGAIAHAHTLLAESSWTSASLRRLLERELAAYGLERTELSGADLILNPGAAQPFALAIHELATNAAKYGALSSPSGRLRVSWRDDAAGGGVRLTWRECGGPVVQPPSRQSFGSTLIGMAVRQQIGGMVEHHWNPQGLVCELLIPRSRLTLSAVPATAGVEPTANAARVLVVEDDPLIALDIAAILGGCGHEVVGPAGSVAEALRLLASERIDAAVVDADLRGEPAKPVADRLTALGVPFLDATGYGTLPELGEAGSLPATSKPFAADDSAGHSPAC